MMLIPCPHCGPRNEDEFVCWSELVPRPADPDALSDTEWVDYLYNHDNPKGEVQEKWWHARGCRRWIVITRNTVTHAITGEIAARPLGPQSHTHADTDTHTTIDSTDTREPNQ